MTMAPVMQSIVMRSMLYMPVTEQRFIESAWHRGADAIILDLEDSVPAHRKADARRAVREAIPIAARGGASICVRINSDSVAEDLDAAVWPGLELVIRPKAGRAEDVAETGDLISYLERQRGLPPGTVKIWPLIETAAGVVNAYDIAKASPRVTLFGGGEGYDMSLDLGVSMFTGFDQFFYSRGEAELAGRALGKALANCLYYPDDSGEVADARWAQRYAEALRGCGFRTATALHPATVAALTSGLTPSATELADAHLVTEGRSADAYDIERARELLAWALLCKERDALKDTAVREYASSGANGRSQ